MKRLIVQRRAMRDLEAARNWYRQEAPHMVADFAVEADAALLHIRGNAATGSPRYAVQPGMPGLRSWPLARFPYIVQYFDSDDQVTVARIFHQAQDIPAHLQN